MSAYCYALFSVILSISPSLEQASVCERIVAAAENNQVDAELLVSLAWHESAMHTTAYNHRSGAVGPLQILPKYWCKNKTTKNCNLIQAGVDALKAWQKVSSSDVMAICKYNSGNICRRRSKRWAKLVVKVSRRIRKIVDDELQKNSSECYP